MKSDNKRSQTMQSNEKATKNHKSCILGSLMIQKQRKIQFHIFPKRLLIQFIRFLYCVKTNCWVNTLNSGSVINIRNRPQSSPSLISGTKGRKVTHQCVMGLKATKRPFIVHRGLFPVLITLPEFSEFTL